MTSRIFLDSSVLFAATYSTTGSARDLILLAAKDQVALVLSADVIEETHRNLSRKAPTKAAALAQLIELLTPEMVQPSLELIREAEEYTVSKDAPIVAAAIAAQVDFLVTYDRRDLLAPPEVARRSGLAIVTPNAVLKLLKHRGE